jgi:hypothetical protein
VGVPDVTSGSIGDLACEAREHKYCTRSTACTLLDCLVVEI